MSWEQRNADFCNAQTDAQMAYIEAEREVDRLQTDNAKLRERIHELEMEGSDHFYRTAYAEDANRTLEAENAKLRELVQDIADHIKHDDGFGIDHGWMLDRIRELGVEVD